MLTPGPPKRRWPARNRPSGFRCGLGRLALPACICRVTTWEQQTQPVRLTDTAAVALAVRTCRAQLLRDFPDAEIEAEQRETTTETGTAAATVTYIFTADIARAR